MDPISAILTVVDDCRLAKKDVVQNREKSARLMEWIEAVEASLRRLVKENEKENEAAPIAHEETLRTLKATVEAARALLQRQSKRNYVGHLLTRGAVHQELDGITLALRVGAGGKCLPRHHPHFRPSFLELTGIL
jgi:Arc/MetJ family transcription regulator